MKLTRRQSFGLAVSFTFALANPDQYPLPTPVLPPKPVAEPPEQAWTNQAKITSYCLNGLTRSETRTREGIIATDPNTIPLGSVVEIEGLGEDFVAEDTGTAIKGWHIDVWKPSCRDAIEFGRQQRLVRVKRWGWE